MTLDGAARTVLILVRGKERGEQRCGASVPTSDAATRQKRHRPEGVAQRAIMAVPSGAITL